MHVEVCTTASAAWAVRYHLTTAAESPEIPVRDMTSYLVLYRDVTDEQFQQ